MLVTNEFSFRTHRQNIIDGWSRRQFVDVKIAMAVIIALVSTLMVILTALVFGFASGTSFGLDNFESVFNTAVMVGRHFGNDVWRVVNANTLACNGHAWMM